MGASFSDRFYIAAPQGGAAQTASAALPGEMTATN